MSKLFRLFTAIHQRRAIKTKINRLIEKPAKNKTAMNYQALQIDCPGATGAN
jgi:hypothetical protein